jgi:hypothetical protein
VERGGKGPAVEVGGGDGARGGCGDAAVTALLRCRE